jgi:death-on-curing protein
VKEPASLDVETTVALHDRLIVDFGGLPGARDRRLLESALTRPRNLLAYGQPGLFELAASLGFGLARKHPFPDGNKRITLTAIDVFLQLNGFELTAGEPEAVVAIRELAAGSLGEEQLARWIEQNAAAFSPRDQKPDKKHSSMA